MALYIEAAQPEALRRLPRHVATPRERKVGKLLLVDAAALLVLPTLHAVAAAAAAAAAAAGGGGRAA